VLPTGRRLQELAQETGFDVASLEKVARLANLLEGIGGLEGLATRLALKGGTALNLAFGRPSRLSVDLDFNLVGAESREELLEVRPGVESKLQALARSQGFGIQRSADAHAGRKFFLRYSRIVDAQPDRIEVDLNYLHRVCLLPTDRRTIWRPDAEGPVTKVLSWPEIAAGKLVAFLDRAAPRDAWDVSRLPQLSPDSWPPLDLKPIFIALAGTLPRPLHEYGRKGLDRIRDIDVSRLLWPMLLTGERPDAQSLREACWSVVVPLLDLTESQIEFCDRLQRGELRPEFLSFHNSEIVERVRRHPALLWKAENARGHARRGERR
jgi:predicted nucleotidyltransferase component of viral defense system